LRLDLLDAIEGTTSAPLGTLEYNVELITRESTAAPLSV
jgi:hypothetical protein